MKSMMRAHLTVMAIAVIFATMAPVSDASSPWGANYFPNVPLITDDGDTVLFFDDLIKDKIVSINFIYTTCADTCPLETAQLVRVQRILGDRLGKDVFFYSISIDPDHDTPEVLKEYKERFGANWTFLTGDEEEIIELRRKLGLYIEEIEDGSLNHNVNMIIGNQATGRWMKRSPFENPYFLATQIGSWLHNWKLPSNANRNSYADAPKLQVPTMGENLFRTRCVACHTVGAGDIGEPGQRRLGPDLLGVTQKRDRAWLARWLAEPEKMLAEKDPIIMEQYARFNEVPMPNMRLNELEVASLIDYMESESRRVKAAQTVVGAAGREPHGDHDH